MDYSQYGSSSGQYANQYGYAQGYGTQFGQQQYQATPPQIRNPFAPPPSANSTYAGPNAAYDPEYEQQLAQWNSAYAPVEQQDRGKKGGKLGQEGAGSGPSGNKGTGVGSGPVEGGGDKSSGGHKEKEKTVIRRGGGETWEDKSLLEWDPTQFRIMVGNLAGEVTDDSLAKAFAQYGVSKARVVRDKRTTKSKGYGFVSFTDSEQGFKAAREMLGKYIGSHPVTIERSKTNLNPVVKKDHSKHKGKNHRNNKDKAGKAQDDPLRANTGAHIEKKPVRNVANAGLKLLG